MGSINTETETVIKKILPYMKRRGYNIEQDFDFETAVSTTDRYTKGYVDILVTLGKKTPFFLIEAKRLGKNLTKKDRDQAILYARSKEIKVPFVVVTNGKDIQCFNTKNKQRIIWNGKRSDKVPSRSQIEKVVKTLRIKPDEVIINISNDESLPYRHGLPLRQLNALFARGHNTIRKIEKDEDYAFADFSKLLFLKLLEEKNDLDESFSLPYSYKFYELAEYPIQNADQVKNAIKSMISQIVTDTSYGEVLTEPLRLENPKTFLGLVKDLASVSFCDCSVDSKGAAFEYYVRATLKGKKLGQYFTPRELVQVMTCLIGEDKIINSVIMGSKLKVLDPACGTGGFLVYLMQEALSKLQVKLKNRDITKESYDQCVKRIKEDIFYGSDANRGVAASAKMNMIIASDGHTHIVHEDSLSAKAVNWSVTKPDCNLIMTNPPFGTAEGDSLFSGIVKCGNCGCSVCRRTTRYGKKWVCNAKDRKGMAACDFRDIYEIELEAAATKALAVNEFKEDLVRREVKLITIDNAYIVFNLKDGKKKQILRTYTKGYSGFSCRLFCGNCRKMLEADSRTLSINGQKKRYKIWCCRKCPGQREFDDVIRKATQSLFNEPQCEGLFAQNIEKAIIYNDRIDFYFKEGKVITWEKE